MLTIAVTGASGAVGRAVVAHALAEGHRVVGLDLAPKPTTIHKNYTYTPTQLTDYPAFLSATRGCDALIHLAATYSLQNPKDPDGPLLREVPEHVVHNTNSAMSYNALAVAAELGIWRVALASSVNAIGLIFSKRPQFDYLPLDEKHACRPEDAYSLCKLCVQNQANLTIRELERQCDAFARRHPSMRIASIRPHWVIPESLAYDPVALDAHGGTAKDLWGWVSETATARAFLQALTAPEETFPRGHETFFIVAPTTTRQGSSAKILKETFPEVQDVRGDFSGNRGFFDCSKAERMLGWTERAFPWSP